MLKYYCIALLLALAGCREDEEPGKRMLIDASRDGGVWWSPQVGPFNVNDEHQGMGFEEWAREVGYEITVLERGVTLTTQLLAGYDVIYRPVGNLYGAAEIEAYAQALKNGSVLILTSAGNGGTDQLAQYFGVIFGNRTQGTITSFTDHALVQHVDELAFSGRWITTDGFTQIQPIASLNDKIVMAEVPHAQSRIIAIGDFTLLAFPYNTPGAFMDNLKTWLAQ